MTEFLGFCKNQNMCEDSGKSFGGLQSGDNANIHVGDLLFSNMSMLGVAHFVARITTIMNLFFYPTECRTPGTHETNALRPTKVAAHIKSESENSTTAPSSE
eukprot:3910973-Amphidinium_carterae.1